MYYCEHLFGKKIKLEKFDWEYFFGKTIKQSE